MDLSGKYTLITGAAGLLGAEHAKALLDVGYNIIITDINIKKLKILQLSLNTLYPNKKIVALKMDVSKEESVQKVIKNICLSVLLTMQQSILRLQKITK